VSPLAVVHDIPGRLRLRLPGGVEGDGIEAAMLKLPGVGTCRWSPLTRGVLIQYRPDAVTPAALVDAVAAHTGTPAPSPDVPAAETPPRTRGRPALARALADAVSELDDSVARATRGALDLRILLPIALTVWALRELSSGRAGPLAWSSALWYAHGLFRDYGVPSED